MNWSINGVKIYRMQFGLICIQLYMLFISHLSYKIIVVLNSYILSKKFDKLKRWWNFNRRSTYKNSEFTSRWGLKRCGAAIVPVVWHSTKPVFDSDVTSSCMQCDNPLTLNVLLVMFTTATSQLSCGVYATVTELQFDTTRLDDDAITDTISLLLDVHATSMRCQLHCSVTIVINLQH